MEFLISLPDDCSYKIFHMAAHNLHADLEGLQAYISYTHESYFDKYHLDPLKQFAFVQPMYSFTSFDLIRKSWANMRDLEELASIFFYSGFVHEIITSNMPEFFGPKVVEILSKNISLSCRNITEKYTTR